MFFSSSKLPQRLRTILYSLIIVTTFTETGLGFATAFVLGFSRLMLYYGGATASFSFITWIWTSVLLFYSYRPRSSYVLTKTFVHFYSFASFCVIWLVLAILIFTDLPIQCDFERDSDGEAEWWCTTQAWTAALALTPSILSGVAAVFIRKQSNGMSSHVCSGQSDYNELGLASAL